MRNLERKSYFFHMSLSTYGPIDNNPLCNLASSVWTQTVKIHSKTPVKDINAIKCEANFRLPNLRSNIRNWYSKIMQNIASLVSKKAHLDVQSRQNSPLFSESAK